MNRIWEFLSGFDDRELAYFAKFKLSTYMPQSQEEINSYLAERKINENKIDQLISENPETKLPDNTKRCNRCYSDKLRKNRVVWAEDVLRTECPDPTTGEEVLP